MKYTHTITILICRPQVWCYSVHEDDDDGDDDDNDDGDENDEDDDAEKQK